MKIHRISYLTKILEPWKNIYSHCNIAWRNNIQPEKTLKINEWKFWIRWNYPNKLSNLILWFIVVQIDAISTHHFAQSKFIRNRISSPKSNNLILLCALYNNHINNILWSLIWQFTDSDYQRVTSNQIIYQWTDCFEWY